LIDYATDSDKKSGEGGPKKKKFKTSKGLGDGYESLLNNDINRGDTSTYYIYLPLHITRIYYTSILR